ncbi:hypothetical protein BJ508DRAFT_348519, partial [Ascobolus immersus RN42]
MPYPYPQNTRIPHQYRGLRQASAPPPLQEQGDREGALGWISEERLPTSLFPYVEMVRAAPTKDEILSIASTTRLALPGKAKVSHAHFPSGGFIAGTSEAASETLGEPLSQSTPRPAAPLLPKVEDRSGPGSFSPTWHGNEASQTLGEPLDESTPRPVFLSSAPLPSSPPPPPPRPQVARIPRAESVLSASLPPKRPKKREDAVKKVVASMMMRSISNMQAATNRVSLGQFQFIWKNIQMMRADKPSEFEAYNGYNAWKRNRSAPTSDQLRLEAKVKQHFGEFDHNFDLPTQFLWGERSMAHELIPCEGHAMYPGSHKWSFPTTMQAQCKKNGWDCVFDREYYLGDLNPYNPCGFEPREGGPIKLNQLDLARAKPSDYPRGISNCLVTEFDGFDTGSPTWKRPAFPTLTKTAARIRLGIDSSQTRASTMSAALAVTVVYPAALDAQCMRGKFKTPGLGSLA